MGQHAVGIANWLRNSAPQRVKNKHILAKQGVNMVGHLLFFQLAVPFLQNINKKSELLVFLMELMTIEFLQFETRVCFRLEQALNVLLEREPIVDVDYVLQRSRHASNSNIILSIVTSTNSTKLWLGIALANASSLLEKKAQSQLLTDFVILSGIIIMIKEELKKVAPDIFLFINPGSGGGIGRQLLDLKVKQLDLEVCASQYEADRKRIIPVTLNLIDMTKNETRDQGFTALKKAIHEFRKVILVICGGDGSVMWVVSELYRFDIDHFKVPVAMLPLGTGNDFSQVLGWGKECPSDLLSNNYAKLRKRVSYWLSAREEDLDLWMVEATVHDYGKFQKVSKLKNSVLEGKTFTKHFCNYFSVGYDGKVGYSFDMHRTSTRLGNLAMYGGIGFVKSFTKTKTLGELTSQFKQIRPKPIKAYQIKLKLRGEQQTQQQNNAQELMIMSRGSREMEDFRNNQNILFQNINSFMGGVKDIWKGSTTPAHLKFAEFTEQSHFDRKIEVVSFSGAWSLAFEKSVGGFATKLHQGQGPFCLKFNDFPKEQKHRTYLQIDGQFIRFTHPKQVVVKRSTISRTNQMRVLCRLPDERQRKCCC